MRKHLTASVLEGYSAESNGLWNSPYSTTQKRRHFQVFAAGIFGELEDSKTINTWIYKKGKLEITPV